MRKIFIILLFGFSLTAFCQAPYWQQEVNYEIDVTLNDRDHTLTGRMKLNYRNQSPDTLDFIWFRLWPNAYKNNETAFARQVMKSKGGARLRKIKDKGFIDSLHFTSGNTPLKMEAHPEHIDIMKVWLAQPLLPGQSVDIATPFFVKLPTYNSRSGHSDESYMVCQWYPKPAVYDRKGWHPMPYLDQGEFYSEFGSFDVRITLPESYTVAATGELQNPEPRLWMGQVEVKTETPPVKKKSSFPAKIPAKKTAPKKPASNKPPPVPQPETQNQALKTLQYKQDKIHDFAWFASKNFTVKEDTIQLASGRVVRAYSF